MGSHWKDQSRESHDSMCTLRRPLPLSCVCAGETLVGRRAVARASARKAVGKSPRQPRDGRTRPAGGGAAGPVGVTPGLHLESEAQSVGPWGEGVG